MMARRAFPRDISPNAGTEELRAYLGDLLDHLVAKRRAELTQAGFSAADLFTLRRVGNAYRTGTLTPEIMQTSVKLFDRLGDLRFQ